MKQLISSFAIIILAVLSSCGSPASDKNDIDNIMPIIGIAMRNQQNAMLSIQAFNSHNANEILRYWDSSAVDYGDGTTRPIAGIDSLRDVFAFLLKAIPTLRVDSLKTLTDNGEHVIVTGQWSGTFKNDSLGIKERTINFWNGDFFTFNERGKIIQHKSIQSHLTILAQLGLLDKLK